MSNTRRLLTSSEVKLELELFNQHDTWREAFPNTNELLIEAGVKEGDTMAQLYSRTKGAQVAYELQKNRPLIVVSD